MFMYVRIGVEAVHNIILTSLRAKSKGQSRMDNRETLATLGTKDTGQRQAKQKNITQHIKSQ
jgi:hypothetical protein